MQLINTIFKFSTGLFIACLKLLVSFIIICLVGAVPVGLVKRLAEKVKRRKVGKGRQDHKCYCSCEECGDDCHPWYKKEAR